MKKLGCFIGLALLITSCANPLQSVGSSPNTFETTGPTLVPSVAGLPNARLVPLTNSIKYVNAGYDLEPPGSSIAKIPSNTAYANCLTGDAVCVVGASPSISLAIVSQEPGTGGGQINADGTITSDMHNTLAWVITYTGATCLAKHSPQTTTSATDPSESPPAMQPCTIVDFVSADTGKVIVSVQSASL